MEHSEEWWQGYMCQFPRSRNPYQGNPETVKESQDWLAGWSTRFFGEAP